MVGIVVLFDNLMVGIVVLFDNLMVGIVVKQYYYGNH
jgi:hypothetical protein